MKDSDTPDPWFSPRDIRFKPEHCYFLIQHLGQLEQGDYPDELTNYNDAGGERHLNKSKFEACVGLAAEIRWRLARTKGDGDVLLAEVHAGTEIRYLPQRAQNALGYIAGWRRKRMRYSHWRADKAYKKRQNISLFDTRHA